MTLEELLYAHVTSYPTVQAYIGQRLYPVTLPQNPTYPAATYRRVSTNVQYTRDGDGVGRARFQVDCYATMYSQIISLANVMEDALEAFTSTMGPNVSRTTVVNRMDDYEWFLLASGETDVYRIPIDCIVYYVE